MKSKNVYRLPLGKGDIGCIDRASSPAHVGRLRHSIDFACHEGTPVKAALGGRVVFVKDDSNEGGFSRKYWNSGNRIEIEHANGEYSAYEHLQHKGAIVEVGDLVRAGQIIGYSGNTGYSSGPHLHFEVFHYKQGRKNYDTLEVQLKA